MMQIDFDTFSEMVELSWNELPIIWQDKLKDANISYQIMNYASKDILDNVNISNPMGLLGLYTGVPVTARRSFSPLSYPDRILLFRMPITRRAKDIPHLKEIISHVLYHEIGHYFGLDEDELRKAQKGSNPL